MALILPVLLLSLFLQCTPSYSQQLCNLENATNTESLNFTISPAVYKPNTSYIVRVSGLENKVRVALSASMNNSAIGSWENSTSVCSGILNETSSYLEARWTSSSEDYHNVEFRAYAMVGNETHFRIIIINSSVMTTMNNASTTPMTPLASVMTTMNNASTTPMTPRDESKMTSSMTYTTNSMITQTSASTTMKTTTSNDAGMVLGFKSLHAFTCLLLFLVTAP